MAEQGPKRDKLGRWAKGSCGGGRGKPKGFKPKSRQQRLTAILDKMITAGARDTRWLDDLIAESPEKFGHLLTQLHKQYESQSPTALGCPECQKRKLQQPAVQQRTREIMSDLVGVERVSRLKAQIKCQQERISSLLHELEACGQGMAGRRGGDKESSFKRGFKMGRAQAVKDREPVKVTYENAPPALPMGGDEHIPGSSGWSSRV